MSTTVAVTPVRPAHTRSLLVPALLLGLYAVAVLTYVLLGRGQPIPQVVPDEFTYSALARSVAEGQGLTWRGGDESLTAALWVYLIAPAWKLTGSQTDAYALAKVIASAIACLVVFPTWLIARRFMTPALALMPATLAVTGTWMAHSTQLITENVALPLAAASLAALTAALLRPGSRWGLVALAFALLATWGRLQLGVLFAVILVVLAIDVASERAQWRERAREHRWALTISAVVTGIGLTLAVARPSSLGFYEDVVRSASLSGVPGALGRQTLAYVAMSGFAPVLLVLAASTSGSAWRDRESRTILTTVWIATAALLLQSAITLPRLAGVEWSIERYVQYSIPLLLVAAFAVVVAGTVRPRAITIVTIVTALLMLLTREVRNIQEQRGVYGISLRLGDAAGLSAGVSLAVVTVVVGLLLLAALTVAQRRRGPVVVWTTLAVTLGVFLLQGQASWHFQREQSSVARAADFPGDLSWVDRAAGGTPVARLLGAFNPDLSSATEFFNKSIRRVYTVSGATIYGRPVQGRTCSMTATANGALELPPSCGPPPSTFLLSDDLFKPTFYDQRVLASSPGGSRLVRVPADAPPRLKAVIRPDCTARVLTANQRTGRLRRAAAGCSDFTSGQLWLDTPGKVALTFSGGTTDQLVSVTTSDGGQPTQVALPAGQITTVPVELPPGASQYNVQFGWLEKTGTSRFPKLRSVELTQDGRTEQLLY